MDSQRVHVETELVQVCDPLMRVLGLTESGRHRTKQGGYVIDDHPWLDAELPIESFLYVTRPGHVTDM